MTTSCNGTQLKPVDGWVMKTYPQYREGLENGHARLETSEEGRKLFLVFNSTMGEGADVIGDPDSVMELALPDGFRVVELPLIDDDPEMVWQTGGGNYLVPVDQVPRLQELVSLFVEQDRLINEAIQKLYESQRPLFNLLKQQIATCSVSYVGTLIALGDEG